MPLSDFDLQTIAEEYDESVIRFAELTRALEAQMDRYQDLLSANELPRQFKCGRCGDALYAKCGGGLSLCTKTLVAREFKNMMNLEELVNKAKENVSRTYAAQLLLGMVKPCAH